MYPSSPIPGQSTPATCATSVRDSPPNQELRHLFHRRSTSASSKSARPIIPKELDGANLTENACRLVFNPGVISTASIASILHFRFPRIRESEYSVRRRIKLATFTTLSAIAFRSPARQAEATCCQLDTLHEETQRLESIYQQKIAKLEELKKSLLHQAFTGEL